MSSEPLPQLDYATFAPPWFKRERIRRGLIAITTVSLLLAAACGIYTNISRISLAYHRHQCMTFTAPPDRVVYESDPIKAKLLIASDQRYVVFEDTIRTACAFSCQPWQRYNDRGEHVAFLHGRRKPDGDERLVAVLFSPPFEWAGIFPCPYVEQAGKVQSYPNSGRSVKSLVGFACEQTLRVFAGQPDPTDESHFTIVYEARNQRGTIDGYLQNDDTITLTIRDGPAKR